MNNGKNVGIITSSKQIAPGRFLCGVVFKNSVFLTVIALSRNVLTMGMYVFGNVFKSDEVWLFRIESVEFFLGISFWESLVDLSIVLKIMYCLEKNVPQNLIVQNLYETFVGSLKKIPDQKEKVVYRLKAWINNAI